MIIRKIILIWSCFGAGIFVAGSFFAFICLIGVIPRLASVTKTEDKILLYENSLCLGIIFFHAVYFIKNTPLSLPFWLMDKIIVPVIILFFGVFTGCLAGALAEVLNTLPIFERRIHLKDGMKWGLLGWGLGKFAGSLLGFYILK